MSNTLRATAGKGGGRITDTALHTGLDIDQIVILEDSTGFTTVNMQTRNDSTLEWGTSQQIAGTTTEPHLGTGHKAQEYIALEFNEQRIVAIQLSGGSIRYYNRS